MKRKVRQFSKEHKKNLSISHMGNPGTFLGMKHSDESKRKMSLALKSLYQKGHPSGNKGKTGYKHSEEAKKKISEALKGKPGGMLGKKQSIEARMKMSLAHKGKKSHLWKGGLTAKNDNIRHGIEFRLWREAVFARDNWTCQKTSKKGCKIEPHHIQNFSQHPELRFAIDNGITLSIESHREFHSRYGRKDNTKDQIDEFLQTNK